MNRRLAVLGLALASIPPGYAGFVYGWQLVSFGGFAVRLDEGLPGAVWLDVVVLALRMSGIAVGLFLAWRAASRSRLGVALLALAGAWILAAPILMLLFVGGP